MKCCRLNCKNKNCGYYYEEFGYFCIECMSEFRKKYETNKMSSYQFIKELEKFKNLSKKPVPYISCSSVDDFIGLLKILN